MDKRVASIAVLIAVCIGCNQDVQLGQFVVKGLRSEALRHNPRFPHPHIGTKTVVHGYDLNKAHESAAAEIPLIFVLDVCPNAQWTGIQAGPDIAESYVSTFSHTYHAVPEDVTFRFTWDRQSDTVEIGGTKFNREDGNIFVALRDENGSFASWQVGTIGPKEEVDSIMRRIRDKLPDQPVVAEVAHAELSE